jgi:ubiquinol-cytochrome c reductase cytochrome c subunit
MALAVRFVLLVFALAATAFADDDEDRELERALGRRAFEENCLMCHAAELTTAQRLSPAQWRAEVDKMIGWGSPLPREDVGRLASYLAREYPTDSPGPSPERLPAEKALNLDLPEPSPPPTGDASLGASLFTKNCANCHGPAALGGDLGTNLVEKPILLRPEAYRGLVRAGLRRMPGFRSTLTTSQEADVLSYLRTLRTRTDPASR